MNRPLQRELFAQRPVRSDFARRRGGDDNGPGLNLRKVMILGFLVVAAIGIGIGVNALNSGNRDKVEEVPTIQAELPIKERPEQPGGIDIPHQDVAVFDKLDNKTEPKASTDVEHLLPAPEVPQAAPVVSQTQTASTQPTETPSAQAVASDQAPATTPSYEELPPAVTSAEPDASPVKEETVKSVEPVSVKNEEPKPVAVDKPKAATMKAVTTKSTENSVKTVQKASKTPTTESQKADAALARLPKELFTKDDYVPPAKTETAAIGSKPSASATPEPAVSSGKSASVQLASMPDEAAAQKEASRYQSKYAGILGGATLRVVRADLGGKGVFYRIMSSSMPEAKAKAVCSDITKLRKGSCLVVK